MPDAHTRLSRRSAILASAAGGVAVLLRPLPAQARPALQAAIQAFAGGAPISMGKVKLEVPPLVENGNAVGVAVSVETPTNAGAYVRRIALFNEKNPEADVAVFHLGPRAGRAQVSTRIRLATSQVIAAVAELSDGTYWSSQASVVVTLAACIEDF